MDSLGTNSNLTQNHVIIYYVPDSVGDVVPALKGLEQSGYSKSTNHQTVENSKTDGMWKERPSLV